MSKHELTRELIALGVKPTRAAKVRVEVHTQAERPSEGKRPVVSVRERVSWTVIGAVDTHGGRITLFESDAGFRIERNTGRGVSVTMLESIADVEHELDQLEYGAMGRCASEVGLFERLTSSHSYDSECECALCQAGKETYEREFQLRLEHEIKSTRGTGHGWMFSGWGCPNCRK